MADVILTKVLEAAKRVFAREVGERDDFFSLGGDSLVALELISLLETELGSELDVLLLLDAEDFGDLAEKINEDLGR